MLRMRSKRRFIKIEMISAYIRLRLLHKCSIWKILQISVVDLPLGARKPCLFLQSFLSIGRMSPFSRYQAYLPKRVSISCG